MVSTRLMRKVFGFAVVIAVAGAACKKDGAQPDKSTPVPGGTFAAPVAGNITMAPLFAHIPADSPFVLASLEAVPFDVMDKMTAAMGPSIKRAIDMFRMMGGDSEAGRVLDATIKEFDGKLNVAGLESLGFSASPRFAIYGLGLMPVVLRLELKDDRAVLATVQRIAKNAGLVLPPAEIRSGKEFWRLPLGDDNGVIISLADKHLVVAAGPKALIAATIDVILGSQLPVTGMADGAALKALMVAHGFGPNLVGFADSKRIATEAIALVGGTLPPACKAQIDQLATRAPRVALGYGEFSAKQITGGFVVELAADLVSAIDAVRVEVPGLATVMKGKQLMAFGGGLDLVKARLLGSRLAQQMIVVGEACADNGLVRGGQELAEAMTMPLPKPLEGITGGIVSVETLTLDPAGRMPVKDVAGFAMVTAASPKALWDFAVAQQPQIEQLGIKPDGKLHAIDPRAMGLPFPLFAGVGDRALVVAAGDKKHGDVALALTGGGKSPLLAMSFDYGRVMTLSSQFQAMQRAQYGLDPDPAAALSADVDAALAKIYGHSTFTVTTSDKGLRLWGVIELK